MLKDRFVSKELKEEAAPAEGTGQSVGGSTEPTLEELKAELQAIKAEKEKLANNNKSLLQEKIDAKRSAEEAAQKLADEEAKKAREEGNSEKLLAIATKELEKTKQLLEQKEQKEKERAAEVLKKAQEKELFQNAFKDFEFHDIEVAKKLVSWDKIVPEKDSDGKLVGFNKDGVNQVKEELINKYPFLFKNSEKNADKTKTASGGDSAEEIRRKEILAAIKK